MADWLPNDPGERLYREGVRVRNVMRTNMSVIHLWIILQIGQRHLPGVCRGISSCVAHSGEDVDHANCSCETR